MILYPDRYSPDILNGDLPMAGGLFVHGAKITAASGIRILFYTG